jgi:hypothetical protein
MVSFILHNSISSVGTEGGLYAIFFVVVGEGVGVGEKVWVGVGVTDGVGIGFTIATPLLHTNFLPDLMQE